LTSTAAGAKRSNKALVGQIGQQGNAAAFAQGSRNNAGACGLALSDRPVDLIPGRRADALINMRFSRNSPEELLVRARRLGAARK